MHQFPERPTRQSALGSSGAFVGSIELGAAQSRGGGLVRTVGRCEHEGASSLIAHHWKQKIHGEGVQENWEKRKKSPVMWKEKSNKEGGQKIRTKKKDQILTLNKISEMEKFKPLVNRKCWGFFLPSFFP